jgi:exopolysaccharide biosynthesis polyprenyl glycosylphosphotransferase
MKIIPGKFSGFLASIVDIPAIYFILVTTYYLRFHSGVIINSKGIPEFSIYSDTFWFISVAFWFIFSFCGLYQRSFRFSAEASWNLTKTIFLGFLLLSTIAFFYRGYNYSRTGFVLALLFITIGMNVFYILKDRIIRFLAPLSFQRSNILIIGTGTKAIDTYRSLREQQQELNLSVIGPSSIHLPNDINYLGDLSQLNNILSERLVNEIIIALPSESAKTAMKIIDECRNSGLRFSIIPDLFEVVTRQLKIGPVHGIPVMPVSQGDLGNSIQLFLKRVMDISLSSISIIVFSPLLFLIWILVKIEDGGPLFYSQERVGLDGRIFDIYKFRSMRVNAEDKSGPMWAVQNDNRWTKIGTFLRKTSIDELPQLFNVLIGDMSLVGPRPERPFFVNQFKETVPGYMRRHRVRGGITGWAQANGLRGQSSIEERTIYDLHYVENWSLGFDIRIIFQTIFKLVFLQPGY